MWYTKNIVTINTNIMVEKLETGDISSEKVKITNLADLKKLLEKKFGDYFFLFLNPSLRGLSGYLSLPDDEKNQKREQIMFENTKITPEVIETLNKVIAHRTKSMEGEILWAKQRKNETHQKECELILDLFKDKQIILSEDGTVEI